MGNTNARFRSVWSLKCYAVSIWLLLPFGPVSLFGHQFGVEGTVKYQIYFHSGKTAVEQCDNFTFVVNDCNWLVKEIPTRRVELGVEQSRCAYHIASSDGTNFYQLTSSSPPAAGAKSHAQVPVYHARIGPGSIPFCLSEPKLILLWYAFGSSCYFENIKDTYLNPPTILGQDDYARDFRVAGIWKLHNAAPFLPESISFDAACKFQTELRANSKRAWQLTNCVFNVDRFTNYGELKIPAAISVQFFNNSRKVTNAAFRTAVLTIDVQRVFPATEETNFTPAIATRAFVSDMRTISSNTPFGRVYRGAQNWPNIHVSEKSARTLQKAMNLGSRGTSQRATQ